VTAIATRPEIVLGDAETEDPYAAVVPYLKMTEVTFAPFGFTVPARVAPFVVTADGAPVAGVGASTVVNDCSAPQFVPNVLVPQSR
jgi:hypothetical protein